MNRSHYQDPTYTVGKLHTVPVVQQGTGQHKKHRKHKKKQEGGAFLAPIIAADLALKTLKPFSRVKKALEDNIKNKSNPLYRVTHKIADVGTSVGYGPKKRKSKKHK